MTAAEVPVAPSDGELAERFGTPLYVYDVAALSAQYRTLREALHEAVEFFYSLKANPNIAVVQVLHGLGAGAEVSSLAELVTAGLAGVPADRTIFLGPGKSAAELELCLDNGVGYVVCESLAELDLHDRLAAERGRVAPVLLRVNPAFEAKGGGLTMGGKPRQFGIDEEQLLHDPDLLARWPHLDVAGVQAYLGTRFLNEEVIAANTDRILELAARLAERLGIRLRCVDVGGGLGVSYFDGERDLDVPALAAALNPAVERFQADRPDTRIIMELGRYLTAPAGRYLTRVRYTKESRGERFAITDGGTNHHMAAVGIGSFVKRNFPVRVVGRDDDHAGEMWNICGPLCTPSDTLVRRAQLPPLRAGDLIEIGRSGAYGPSASPGLFLSHGFPAEVMVVGGNAHLIRARDTVDDLLGRQVPLDRATLGEGW